MIDHESKDKMGNTLCFLAGLFGIFISAAWSVLYSEVSKISQGTPIFSWISGYHITSTLCIALFIKTLVDTFHDALSCDVCRNSKGTTNPVWYKTVILFMCAVEIFGTPIALGIGWTYFVHILILIFCWNFLTLHVYYKHGCKI